MQLPPALSSACGEPAAMPRGHLRSPVARVIWWGLRPPASSQHGLCPWTAPGRSPLWGGRWPRLCPTGLEPELSRGSPPLAADTVSATCLLFRHRATAARLSEVAREVFCRPCRRGESLRQGRALPGPVRGDWGNEGGPGGAMAGSSSQRGGK